MAIYCNTLRHNMQYDIDPYWFIPTTNIRSCSHIILIADYYTIEITVTMFYCILCYATIYSSGIC